MNDISPELSRELETLERKHEDHPEGRFFVPLANAYRKAGGLERAEDLLQRGLEHHPDYLSAYIVLGRCFADRGATEEAREQFGFVRSRDPQNLVALRGLADLAEAEGRPEEATRWYRELLAVDPMNDEAEAQLARLAASDVDDDSEVVTETIAELYARQGFHDRAADVYRQLIRDRGEVPELTERLAELEAMPAGGGEEAEQHFDIASEPEEAETPARVAEEGDMEIERLPEVGGFAEETKETEETENGFAASFENGFDGVPAPGSKDDADADDGAPAPVGIGDHLRALVAWSPASDGSGELATDMDDEPGGDLARADDPEAAETSDGSSASEDFSYDDFFDGTPETDRTPAAVTAERNDESTSANESEEDEDLESFQEWLKSLKD